MNAAEGCDTGTFPAGVIGLIHASDDGLSSCRATITSVCPLPCSGIFLSPFHRAGGTQLNKDRYHVGTTLPGIDVKLENQSLHDRLRGHRFLEQLPQSLGSRVQVNHTPGFANQQRDLVPGSAGYYSCHTLPRRADAQSLSTGVVVDLPRMTPPSPGRTGSSRHQRLPAGLRRIELMRARLGRMCLRRGRSTSWSR